MIESPTTVTGVTPSDRRPRGSPELYWAWFTVSWYVDQNGGIAEPIVLGDRWVVAQQFNHYA